MNEDKFYRELWDLKKAGLIDVKRDWFHRVFLDRLANPFSNDRIEVAGELIKCEGIILDLGIWGGKFLSQKSVSEKFPEKYGLDLIQESVDKAIDLGINASVWNLNHTPYPFLDEQFDVVTLLAVLEHLFDPYNVIKEVNRITKQGGQVIIALPNVASFSNRMRLLFGKLPNTSSDPGWDGGHLHYFTVNSTVKLLVDYGFKVDLIDVTGGLRKLRRLFPSILAGEFLISAIKE